MMTGLPVAIWKSRHRDAVAQDSHTEDPSRRDLEQAEECVPQCQLRPSPLAADATLNAKAFLNTAFVLEQML